jgi:predicted nucleic acid-binding protein
MTTKTNKTLLPNTSTVKAQIVTEGVVVMEKIKTIANHEIEAFMDAFRLEFEPFVDEDQSIVFEVEEPKLRIGTM